jgi:23S rRNA (pseudouridine1915-N3)-methyltransferase
MRIKLIFTEKTSEMYLQKGIDLYVEKLKHYCQLDITIIAAPHFKNGSKEMVLKSEAKVQLSKVDAKDLLIVLDENGQHLSSVEMANAFQAFANRSQSNIALLVGGAYGVDEVVKQRAQAVWSFSKLTFTHQMIRLILVEQLYRAFSILKNEKYHHI